LIISHKHKFIFLKTHKTGGTSLQIALSRNCGQIDIISKLHEDDKDDLNKAGGLDQQNALVPLSKFNSRDWFQYILRGRKQYFSEHLNWVYTKRWIGSKVWNSYYKFCFERNPFDKVLSYYYWRTRNANISLDQFLDEKLDTLSDFKIYGMDDEIQVDNVFLYEDLSTSINILEDRFQFNIDMANVKAKASHRVKKQSFDSELTSKQKEKIAKAFEKEINLFYPDILK